jgi:predicted transcriptional regulator
MPREPDPLSQIETRSGVSTDMEEHIALCPLIRARRKDLGMSQRELSHRSGIPQPHICLIESGQTGMLSSDERLLEAMGAGLKNFGEKNAVSTA